MITYKVIFYSQDVRSEGPHLQQFSGRFRLKVLGCPIFGKVFTDWFFFQGLRSGRLDARKDKTIFRLNF